MYVGVSLMTVVAALAGHSVLPTSLGHISFLKHNTSESRTESISYILLNDLQSRGVEWAIELENDPSLSCRVKREVSKPANI